MFLLHPTLRFLVNQNWRDVVDCDYNAGSNHKYIKDKGAWPIEGIQSIEHK